MALRESIISRLRVTVKVDENLDGTPIVNNRTINRMSPTLNDDDVLAVGTALGSLQKYPLVSIARVDENKVITE